MVESFIQNDLHSFANEIYEEVIQSDWFIDRYGRSGLIGSSVRDLLRNMHPLARFNTTFRKSKRHHSKNARRLSKSYFSTPKQQYSFYDPRGAWNRPSHSQGGEDWDSIEKLKSIFDASLDKLEHMSPEDKGSVKEVAWSKVGYRDYEGEYFNRKEHTQPCKKLLARVKNKQ